MTEVQPDLDTRLGRRFAAPATDAGVMRTAAALEANGISVLRAANKADAKRIVLDHVDAGQFAFQPPHGFDTRYPRHPNIHQNDVGDDKRNLRQRLGSGGI